MTTQERLDMISKLVPNEEMQQIFETYGRKEKASLKRHKHAIAVGRCAKLFDAVVEEKLGKEAIHEAALWLQVNVHAPKIDTDKYALDHAAHLCAMFLMTGQRIF